MPSNKRPMEMLCDNEPALAIASDPGILKGARHFQRKYHYIRELSKLKVLDALPSLLIKVTEALNKFATAIASSSQTTGDTHVPIADQAARKSMVEVYEVAFMRCLCLEYVAAEESKREAIPSKTFPQPKGELIKNKGKEVMSHKEAEEKGSKSDSKTQVRLSGSITNRNKKKVKQSIKADMAKKEVDLGREELADLMCIDVVTNLYKPKLEYDKYCDKMLNRRVKMDYPNITMDEYIRLEEEKAHRRGKVYNSETATYGKIRDNKDIHDLGSIETEFPAIVFNDTLTYEAVLSCEAMVSSLNNDEIDFRISFDESDDEDCTVIFDKISFSYKIISVNDLKTDSENDNYKANMPSIPSPKPTVSYFDDLDFFKDFENEFPAIVYNDAQTSKSDLLTEPILNPQHIDEFNLKDETSLSEYDEEEQNVICFNDLFPFNVIYPDELKTDTDNDNDKVDIEHSSEDLSVKPLPDLINTDVGAYDPPTPPSPPSPYR
ncbi:hypothetical protein Tco_0539515 [Tanacetum coccineum]